MLVPKLIVFIAGVALATYVVVLVLILANAWSDYQHSLSGQFRNVTDDRLCYARADPCSAEIKPHGTSYWDIQGSCLKGQPVQIRINTLDSRVIYSRTADCLDWDGALFLINKRGDEYVVADDLKSTDFKP